MSLFADLLSYLSRQNASDISEVWECAAMARSARRLRSPENKINAVGPQVRARRLALNLTQDQLAARLEDVSDGLWDVAPKELVRLEGGQRLVTDLEVISLATALNCSPLTLLFAENTEPRLG